MPFSTLKAGFASTYIDARNYARHTADEIRTNMDTYITNGADYIAPYTSLITSSMMGKTRLMKEMSRYIPLVYICARSAASTGYPPRTPIVIDWFDSGIAGLSKPHLDRSIIGADKTYILSTLKYTSFLLALFEGLSALLRDKDFIQQYNVRECAEQQHYTWLWDYFAEPYESSNLQLFWEDVLTDAEDRMKMSTSPNRAVRYFEKEFKYQLQNTYEKLIQSFEAVGYQEKITFVLVCDEARHLCEISAADGSPIHEECDVFRGDDQPKVSDETAIFGNVPFSAFRALRRALRFLSQADDLIPRVFGLFTDTSSRLSNFQPSSSEDRSMRQMKLQLTPPGQKQFEPIFTFTSFDAWARIYNDCSSLENVAAPERLMNFGRAGWRVVRHDSAIDIAKGKLLCYQSNTDYRKPWSASLSRQILLKLLAVLAPRLAITAGPYSLEASEIVASHMAVLMKTDEDHHFLRSAYPSEPILAEASARLTAKYGWGKPLGALLHFIQTGIVDAGFRGELLTKIICLMAVDRANELNNYNPFTQWKYSRPLHVFEFLNQLIPLDGIEAKAPNSAATTFSEYVTEHSALNFEDLNRFMFGHVFFTHFIQVECTVSMAMLVRAWNRGAAIMCQAYNPQFDHIIPVMLEGADCRKFGHLYDSWNEEQLEEARCSMSYILIDSKNYSNKTNWRTYVGGIIPQPADEHNIIQHNLRGGLPIKNVYVSMVQDFGVRLDNEPAVIVEPINLAARTTRPGNTLKQLKIILKGIDDKTYECLKNRRESEKEGTDTDREAARTHIAELRTSRVGYLEKDYEKLSKKQKLVFHGVADSLPLIFGFEDEIGMSEEWSSEQWRIREEMQE
jgi:hypothetical protein